MLALEEIVNIGKQQTSQFLVYLQIYMNGASSGVLRFELVGWRIFLQSMIFPIPMDKNRFHNVLFEIPWQKIGQKSLKTIFLRLTIDTRKIDITGL